jgi:hypothetical protein
MRRQYLIEHRSTRPKSLDWSHCRPNVRGSAAAARCALG